MDSPHSKGTPRPNVQIVVSTVLRSTANLRGKKKSNMWRLNDMLLNNEWVNEEIKGENKKYLETNGKGNTTAQQSTGCRKVVVIGKFRAIQTYHKKKKSEIHNLTLYLGTKRKNKWSPN